MKAQRIWGTIHPFFERGGVLGRGVANAAFLDELLRQDPYEAYHFFLYRRDDKEHLEATLQTRYPAMWQEGRLYVGPWANLPNALHTHSYACFHTAEWADHTLHLTTLRNALARTLFPITAPVHTLGYFEYGTELFRFLWGGVSPRDALVATSSTSQAALHTFIAYLREGYSLPPEGFPAPSIQRIPLGVNPGLFAAPGEKTHRGATMRHELGLAGNEVVFLCFARLSYLSKMDFFPILDAFKRAHAMGLAPETYRLVLAGRTDTGDESTRVVAELAREMGIPLSLVPFPATADDERRKALFAAADVFIAPTDTIMETFGLTILEAGAASLPVIASAIDGYKDLVLPGKTGLLIPTLGPSSATATTLASVVEQVQYYQLRLAQQCVVEVPALAQALVTMGTRPDVRASMAHTGRERVLQHYTWEHTVQQYRTLWENLATTPLPPAVEKRLRQTQHPLTPDYLHIFSGHYSQTLAAPAARNRMVRTSPKGKALQNNQISLVVYEMIKPHIDRPTLARLLEAAASPLPLGELADAFAHMAPTNDRDFTLLWALKHDLLEFVEE